MSKNYICLDIGGTSIKSAIINSNNYIIKNTYNKKNLDSTRDKNYIIKNFIYPIKKNIEYLKKHNKIFDGIAIAIGGPFDYKKGISYIKNLDKYESIYGINIKEVIQNKLNISKKLPFIFDIDSWSFGRGEIQFKKYDKYNKAIVITMGTGVGSCFIINKKVIGKGRGIPYLGWLSGKKYKLGILNDYISSIYMVNKYYSITKKKINVKTMAELAIKGDKTAKSIFSEIGSTLGLYLKKHYVKDFETECLIFGGQISLSSNLFINEIKNYLQNINNLKIVKAKDIETSALRGVCKLLIDNEHKRSLKNNTIIIK